MPTDIKLAKRRQNAMQRLQNQLLKGKKSLRGSGEVDLTPEDVVRIKKEIETLKVKLR